MNELSWLIYLAQVLTSLGYLFVGMSIILLIAAAIGVLAACIAHDEADVKTARKVAFVCIPLCVLCAFVGNVLPNKETLYAIAASQLGERIVQSGEVKELSNDAYAALRVWLKKQVQ